VCSSDLPLEKPLPVANELVLVDQLEERAATSLIVDDDTFLVNTEQHEQLVQPVHEPREPCRDQAAGEYDDLVEGLQDGDLASCTSGENEVVEEHTGGANAAVVDEFRVVIGQDVLVSLQEVAHGDLNELVGLTLPEAHFVARVAPRARPRHGLAVPQVALQELVKVVFTSSPRDRADAAALEATLHAIVVFHRKTRVARTLDCRRHSSVLIEQDQTAPWLIKR
jgi:hypothetical protein